MSQTAEMKVCRLFLNLERHCRNIPWSWEDQLPVSPPLDTKNWRRASAAGATTAQYWAEAPPSFTAWKKNIKKTLITSGAAVCYCEPRRDGWPLSSIRLDSQLLISLAILVFGHKRTICNQKKERKNNVGQLQRCFTSSSYSHRRENRKKKYRVA